MILAANFKANHTRSSTKEYLETVANHAESTACASELYVFPPFTALECGKYKNILVGAQDGYPAEKGSYTGEICLDQLNEFNISTILIGHSERRHVIKESQEFIASKYEFFRRMSFHIIYCIGEPVEVRQKGLESVIDYCFKQLENIDLDYSNLVVAYEPVWAIGTGITATPEDIEETHKALREKIAKPLLYGGSVNVGNLGQILKVPNVDGVLVGTASWKSEDFCKLIDIANGI